MGDNHSRVIPKPSEFFLDVPLYKHFEYEEEDYQELLDIKNYEGPLDCHCMWCDRDSVFRTQQVYKGRDKDYALSNGVFSLSLRCSRDKNHKLEFYFIVLGKTIQKIGQFPSLADIKRAGITKYREVLGNQLYNEFSKAIELSNQGIGIGSFVYVKHIFNELLFSTFEESAIEYIDTASFTKLRTDEKFALLKDRLPSYLVENSYLYSILSKKLHSLTEQETLETFPAIRLGIELILDEKLGKDEKGAKIKKAEKEIEEIKNKLNDA